MLFTNGKIRVGLLRGTLFEHVVGASFFCMSAFIRGNGVEMCENSFNYHITRVAQVHMYAKRDDAHVMFDLFRTFHQHAHCTCHAIHVTK